MNKKPLVALSVVGLIALALSTGNVIAQDPEPTANPQPAPLSPEVFNPQSPQQPAATMGTQLGTTMSYQGQLQKSGGPHTGTCNFQFSLWDAATGGAQKGGTIPKNGVTIANGLFSVELDFGNQFMGEGRWLETAVQCTGDTGFTTLLPRQPQNAVPYALGLKGGARISNTTFSESGVIVSAHGAGISANSANSWAFHGFGTSGVYGEASHGDGVYGSAKINGNGVTGVSSGGNGVFGYSTNSIGVKGESLSHDGVQGIGAGTGVRGDTVNGTGVYGQASGSGNGVFGGAKIGVGGYFYSEANHGIYATSDGTYAAYFDGRMRSNVVEIAGGSDLAERFEQADSTKAEPGTAMVADENNPGKLKVGMSAYDTKVVGIVSGAGGINTGLTLHQEGAMTGDLVVAVAGRVYAKCEATSSPIKPGDLLTTSSLPGHCMKAADRERRDGAVIGKAMSGLKDGKGLVLVIVNLQ